MFDGDRQLLRRHHEPALARDAPHRHVRTAELRAQRRGQREAHRARAAGVDEQPRPVVVPPQGGPDLVLPDVGDHDRLAVRPPIHVDQHVLRLQLPVRVLVAKRMLLAPRVDLAEPSPAVLLHRADVRQHRGERLLGVGDQLDVRPHVLAHLGAVDVDVDERLDVWRELRQLGGDAVVDPHPDHHQNVRVLHRLQAPTRAHEPGHVERQGVLHRESPDAQQRGAHRRRRRLGQLLELRFRVAQDHAVTGEDHRPLGTGQRLRGLLGVVQVDVPVQLVTGDLQPLGCHALGVGHLHVLADVDEHRARPAGGRDVERLVDHARQLVDLGHQVAVLRDRRGGSDHVRLLEGVTADLGAVHLAGDRDDRHRVHVGGAKPGHQVQRARSRGGEHDPRPAARAGVAVGHVSSALLVANQDVLEPRMLV